MTVSACASLASSRRFLRSSSAIRLSRGPVANVWRLPLPASLGRSQSLQLARPRAAAATCSRPTNSSGESPAAKPFFLDSRPAPATPPARRFLRFQLGNSFIPCVWRLPLPASLGRSQSLQLPGLALPPPPVAAGLPRPHGSRPPLILGTELPACRLIGYLRVRSNAIELRRFARNSSRSTGSFRSARFFSIFFFFDHQHRLSSFPPCTLINVQASVSPMLAQRARPGHAASLQAHWTGRTD